MGMARLALNTMVDSGRMAFCARVVEKAGELRLIAVLRKVVVGAWLPVFSRATLALVSVQAKEARPGCDLVVGTASFVVLV